VRALVTGATGLIGNAIARRLVADGHEVLALVRSPSAAVPDGVTAVRGDVTDPASLAGAAAGCDVVFHAAGLPEQWRRDEADFDRVNRRGTVNVLAAARDAGVRRVIYTSTMDVFRTDEHGVLREDQPDPDPKPSAYERSKVAAEREADRFVATGLDVVFLNPSSVYGPSPTTTGTTQLFIRLAQRKAPLLPPGGMSLAYVDAVADAHLSAVERGGTGERYLLADTYAPMRDLAQRIAAQLGLRRVPPSAPAWLLRAVAGVSAPLARRFGFTPLLAPGELTFLLWEARVDSSKAQRELGYAPVDLDAGIALTIADLRHRGAL
jgi:nucleoside-diphosphate-sugar epimerase